MLIDRSIHSSLMHRAGFGLTIFLNRVICLPKRGWRHVLLPQQFLWLSLYPVIFGRWRFVEGRRQWWRSKDNELLGSIAHMILSPASNQRFCSRYYHLGSNESFRNRFYHGCNLSHSNYCSVKSYFDLSVTINVSTSRPAHFSVLRTCVRLSSSWKFSTIGTNDTAFFCAIQESNLSTIFVVVAFMISLNSDQVIRTSNVGSGATRITIRLRHQVSNLSSFWSSRSVIRSLYFEICFVLPCRLVFFVAGRR